MVRGPVLRNGYTSTARPIRRLRFRRRSYAGIFFLMACCFAIGFLILWGQSA
jgi:hypothetical protein